MLYLLALVSAGALALTVPPTIEGRDLRAPTPTQATIAFDDAAAKVGNQSGAPKYTVVAFLSARCPCSNSHEPTLAALAREYGKGPKSARFIGVHSNTDETVDESIAHFQKAGFDFPVIQDTGARLANAFGALKTPHVYVIGPGSKIEYQGGVDDSHDAPQASKHYLKDALEALRAGRTPDVTLSRSLGCSIRR